MNGCYQAIPHCEHNQMKGSCFYCNVNDQLKALTDMYKTLSIQCAANHDHKVRQIDENRKISKRFDELEAALKRDFITITERIDSGFSAHLESDEYADEQIRERFEKLEKVLPRYDSLHKEWWDRIEMLEKTVSSLEGKLNEVYTRTRGLTPGRKQPHKCPVCNGTQRDYFDQLYPYSEYPTDTRIDHEGLRFIDCRACEGKGIIWG